MLERTKSAVVRTRDRAVSSVNLSSPRLTALDTRIIAARCFGHLAADSPRMHEVFDLLGPLSKTDMTVTIHSGKNVQKGTFHTDLLDNELPRIGRISFRRLTQSLVERLEVVVRFLALLELFKQGLVDLDQPDHFGDIEVIWLGHERADAELALAGIDAYDG